MLTKHIGNPRFVDGEFDAIIPLVLKKN